LDIIITITTMAPASTSGSDHERIVTTTIIITITTIIGTDQAKGIHFGCPFKPRLPAVRKPSAWDYRAKGAARVANKT
jgi:hypothetical protein